ncbi:hypothetical protein J6V85_01470 [Candidatus Saccharibacteria bacterium]|nr:hypothetical protein [Candidatus Saccharibacteria bacterium]
MKRLKIFSWIIFIALAIVIALNYQFIFDFTRGLFYSPSPEMASIRESLDLSSRGEILFNASMPELNSEEEFNENCHSYDEVETILGCYTMQKIYVYDIKDKELNGIVELTSAHELLHAVYERMSISERDGLRELLEAVYKDNLETLEDEIGAYESAEQLEEIYVRAGTEIKKLPEELEAHYGKIFNDRKKVVKYYEGYNGVFKKYEAEMTNIKAKLDELGGVINEKNEEYARKVDELNARIDAFNNCADSPGCFSTDTEFYNKREELLREVILIDSLYDEIDGLIEQYNVNVDDYNDNVLIIERFQDIINSHVRVEDINN